MLTRFSLTVLVLASWLAGCAGPTLYQAADPAYGYREQQLETNRYRVTFAGNALTNRDTVENYLLYRAAELTLQHGYDFFVVADRDLQVRTRYVYSFSAFPGYGYYRVYGYPIGYGPGVPADGTVWPRTRYEAVADIVMFRGEPAASDVRAFKANELKRFLGNRIVRPALSAAPSAG
jgi:hypothetical protein